jgi:hypothetical protein
MAKKKKTGSPTEIPSPGKVLGIKPTVDPEEFIVPEDDPDIIPDEEMEETPPYELPPEGEGP